MALVSGTRLGSYEIVSALGAGGMGEVYRAHDARLKRDVAIKILPESLAGEADRLARFQREAEVLASINHPHIAAIYGLEHRDGIRALVLELVDGDTLAERIARGPMPLDEALPLAHQIAEALEAAHEAGIVHRDLKPANIKVRPDGAVKVLDFGLAKALDSGGAAAPASSPTITSPALQTVQGVILGTAAYMSPEQARGRPVDKRTDIWAFGCVLFELLTARPAFVGATMTDLLAAVVQRDPDWAALPAGTPAAVRTLLYRCLERDAHLRLRDIGEARIAVAGRPVPAQAPPPERHRILAPVGALAAVAILGAAAGAVFVLARVPGAEPQAIPPPPVSIVWPTPTGTSHPAGPAAAHMALTRDGRTLVFGAVPLGAKGSPHLYVQALDSRAPQRIEGSDGAGYPCWDPDGRRIAYWEVGGTMRTIAATGGVPSTIGKRGTFWGGCDWGPDDQILVGDGGGPIARVSANGSDEVKITSLSRARHETAHVWPFWLPDGKHFLYLSVSPVATHRGIYVARLDGSGAKRIVLADGRGVYASSGHLLWSEKGTIYAQPFDLTRLELTGERTRIVGGVSHNIANGNTAYAISQSGVLAYRAGPGIAGFQSQIVIFDRSLRELQRIAEVETYSRPAFSPDGRLLAAGRTDRESGRGEIWVYDLTRDGLGARVTAPGVDAASPAWSPDGNRLAYLSLTERGWAINVRVLDGSGDERTVYTSPRGLDSVHWAPDGRSLVVSQLAEDDRGDIWVVPLVDGEKARAEVRTPYHETAPRISPDGRWLAYASNESGAGGAPNVYVQSYPSGPFKWRISADGGSLPRWSPDSRTLFYGWRSSLFAVEMGREEAPRPGRSREILGTTDGSSRHIEYDVDPQAERFARLAGVANRSEDMPPITLLINWHHRLPR